MSRPAPQSTVTHSARALLALVLWASAGCSNEGTATFTAGREPRQLSESEVAEIKKTARTSHEFRKMVRANMLADEAGFAPKKSTGKRPTNKAR
jgi:hypothetical protein